MITESLFEVYLHAFKLLLFQSINVKVHRLIHKWQNSSAKTIYGLTMQFQPATGIVKKNFGVALHISTQPIRSIVLLQDQTMN